MNLSNVFDKVGHKVSIAKQEAYGFSYASSKYLENY